MYISIAQLLERQHEVSLKACVEKHTSKILHCWVLVCCADCKSLVGWQACTLESELLRLCLAMSCCSKAAQVEYKLAWKLSMQSGCGETGTDRTTFWPKIPRREAVISHRSPKFESYPWSMQ